MKRTREEFSQWLYENFGPLPVDEIYDYLCGPTTELLKTTNISSSISDRSGVLTYKQYLAEIWPSEEEIAHEAPGKVTGAHAGFINAVQWLRNRLLGDK